jgi:predicted GIY-YIG superfamily endonuclease
MSKKANNFTRLEELFHDSVSLKWGQSSREVWLRLNGEEIWRGNAYNTETWIKRYLQRSKEELLERDFNAWGEKSPPTPHTVKLFAILMAADRRFGWNTLSGWLFTEVDPVVRKVISRRVYGQKALVEKS